MARKASPGTARRIFDAASSTIRSLLPDAWNLEVTGRNDAGGVVRVVAPDGTSGKVAIEVRDRLTPREAAGLPTPDGPTIVAAPWLSPRTRELLENGGLNYIDQTGNTCLIVNTPGIVIRTQGAVRDPSPPPRTRPSLRGPRAWALMRTLVEVEPPYGVTDLSRMLGMDQGYVSRLLTTLSEELLITRQPRGPVESVAWESLLRQIAVDYSLYKVQRDHQLDSRSRSRTVPPRPRCQRGHRVGDHRILRRREARIDCSGRRGGRLHRGSRALGRDRTTPPGTNRRKR